MKKKGIAILMATAMAVSTWNGIPVQNEVRAAKVSSQAMDYTGYTAISTKQELKTITSNGKYYLTADIDMRGEVWQPIGGFSGVFDGNGHTISNLNSVGTNGGGLFDSIKGSATITNVKLENIDVTNSSGLPIGGIVGSVDIAQQGKVEISDCSVNGKVNGTWNVGGIVGVLKIAQQDKAEIFNCSMNGTVNGVNCVGGIVGYTNLNGETTTEIPITVTNCKMQGTIKNDGHEDRGSVGGIGGLLNNTKIEKCCNQAGIQVNNYYYDYAGGLVGRIYNGGIENSFNAGQISSNGVTIEHYENSGYSDRIGGIACIASATNILNVENLGGLIQSGSRANLRAGLVYSLLNGSTLSYGIYTYAGNYYAPYPVLYESAGNSSVMQCYYINHSNVKSTQFGIGITVAEMKNSNTFSSFDFSSVWAMDKSILYGYPTLAGLKDCYEKSATALRFPQQEIQIAVDEKTTMKLVREPEDAQIGMITWQSENPEIAQISITSGVVELTGVKQGTTRIIAENDYGLSAICSVVVSGYKPTSISIKDKQYYMTVGKTFDLKGMCTISPEAAKEDVLTWKSNNPQVVEMSADGIATAKGAGEATITVTTSNGKSASCTITVKDLVVTSDAEKTLELGEIGTISYSVKYSNGDSVDAKSSIVAFSSDQPNIVSVSSSGSITALATGTANITIACGVRSAVCKVTVPEVAFTLPEVRKVYLGNAVDLLYEAVGTNKKAVIMNQVQWESSNPKVAKVSKKGVVTGVKAGTCSIFATYKGAHYICSVTVPKVKIKLSKKSVKVRKNYYDSIYCTYKPTGSRLSIKKITVSKKKKVSINYSSNGISIRGLKKGKTTLKVVFSNGAKKTIKVKVVK